MSGRANATLKLLQDKHSPQLPWAYQWLTRDDEAYGGMRMSLRWWRGCGTVKQCGLDRILSDHDLVQMNEAGRLTIFSMFVERMVADMVRSFAEPV